MSSNNVRTGLLNKKIAQIVHFGDVLPSQSLSLVLKPALSQSLTNLHNALHHGKHTAKADVQCDKLATYPTRQRLRLSTFSSYSESFAESRQFLTYPTCIWRIHWGWPHSSFAEIFGIRNLESLGYRVALFALACWSRTLNCDRRTDRHMTTANTRSS